MVTAPHLNLYNKLFSVYLIIVIKSHAKDQNFNQEKCSLLACIIIVDKYKQSSALHILIKLQ